MFRMIFAVLTVCMAVPAHAATYTFTATLTGYHHNYIDIISSGNRVFGYQPGLGANNMITTPLQGRLSFENGDLTDCYVGPSSCGSIGIDKGNGAYSAIGTGRGWHFDFTAGTLRYEVDSVGNGTDPTLGDYIWWSEFADYDLSNVSVVPLPATLPLFIAGLAGLGWFRRRVDS